jgi:WD40 repeat protein
MVKAYLRYSQVNVLNSLVGKSSNILLSDSG